MKGDAVNGARLKMTERIANANLVAQIVAELEPVNPAGSMCRKVRFTCGRHSGVARESGGMNGVSTASAD
jgi:hypothetical protein